MAKFSESDETILRMTLVDDELSAAKRNNESQEQDYEDFLGLVDSVRSEKKYDWMSDIRLPEFASHWLTQASIDAGTMFTTRDFVECYLQNATEAALAAADAAKELINNTLNRRELHYYQKYVRGGMISQLLGEFCAECWWEQSTREVEVGRVKASPPSVMQEEEGLENPETIDMEMLEETITTRIPTRDCFNFDIVDPRNVYTDKRYTYSPQEKDFIWIRSEKTLDDLIRNKEKGGYFNLDKLEEAWRKDSQTDTNRDLVEDGEPIFSVANRWLDTYKRYGKFWVIPKGKDEYGHPLEVKMGLDKNGFPKKGAERHEVVAIFAKVPGATDPTLIAFHPTPYIDAYGIPYRPILRGKCCIHPTNDAGFGDAKFAYDLQVAIDDTFNLSQDRATLAGLPLFQVQEESLIDNDSLYVEPGHFIKVREQGAISEFKISDNTPGALQQIQMLMGQMQQLDSIQPTTMGRLPSAASTTATAIAGAEQRTDMRSSFKGLTREYTFDADLYWMIMHMTYRFAHPITGIQLLGDKLQHFDPKRDYWFKPLSQSTETEQSKGVKIKNLMSVMQIVMPMAQLYANQPGFLELINHLIFRVLSYMGDEPTVVAGKLFNPQQPSIPMQQMMMGMGGEQGGPSMVPGGVQPNRALMAPETTNQQGMMMSPTEMLARRGGMSAY